MSEWVRGSLGELASGVRGVSYTPNQLQRFMSPETVILLRSNNIKGGQVNFENVQLIPSHIVSKDQLAQHGDIAVCMSNGSKALVGKSGRIEGNEAPCTVGAFCSIFRPYAHADEKFVSYIFQSGAYRRHLDIILAGSAINNLKNSDVEALSLEIPPRQEQRLIARILNTIDTQIQKTEALIAKLEKVKEGLLHDLLTRGIDENGQLRPRPEQVPQLYKESPLGLIPREWGCGSLGELSTSSVIGPFGSDLVASDYRLEGVPVVFVRDVVSKKFTWKSEVYVGHQKAASLSAHNVIAGDVLLTKMGLPPCIACTYPSEFPEGIVTADIVRLRPDKSMVLPDWVSNYANSEHIVSQVRAITSGVTRPKVTLSDVRSLKVAVPPLEDQRAILFRISEASRRVNAARASLSKLLFEKTGLMDDLLTGRVRVTPLLEKSQATTPA